MSVTIRIAGSADIHRIRAAYGVWRYNRAIRSEDTLWIAEHLRELIGAVRIASEHSTLVLRGMRVAELWRGQGIGSRMLRGVAAWLGRRECYCVPYVHLIEFYGQVGFSEVARTAAPQFLAERVAEYRQSALDVTIMMRALTGQQETSHQLWE
jgi:predicted N-acetyltransferase YhbS